MFFWTAIATMVVAGYYFDLQKAKLRHGKRDGGADSGEIKRQIGKLMAENEELKDRLRNVEAILADGKDKNLIDLKNYEKEQVLIDKQNKYRF